MFCIFGLIALQKHPPSPETELLIYLLFCFVVGITGGSKRQVLGDETVVINETYVV